MAFVHLKADAQGAWLNSDGLRIYFGTNEAKVTREGEPRMVDSGGTHVTEVIIDTTALPTVASGDVQIQGETIIPNGAFLERVETLVLKETTSGGSAALNVGLVRQDRSTAISTTGILAACTDVVDGTDLGENVSRAKGGTAAGTLIGTKLTNTGLITAHATTADFTAGVVRVRIHWYIPLAADL
jgi:hypothetical protein